MAATVSNSTLIAFGVYQLDVAKGELRKFDTPIRLQPQPYKLLALLASHPGELVTREQIQEEIWGRNVFVDFERGLNHCVRQIRAALGDDAGTPRYIETVPRRGYRFVAPVKSLSLPLADPAEEKPEAAVATAPEVTPHQPRGLWQKKRLAVTVILAAVALAGIAFLVVSNRRRLNSTGPAARVMVAVLPFENLTGDQEEEYLSDGITDEMIVHLGKVSPRQLGVIARTSAMTYKRSGKSLGQISRELSVNYFLEGAVKRFGPKIRVTAQLVRSQDQVQLWTGSFDGEVTGESLLAFEESTANQVASSLSLVLPEGQMPRGSTASEVAYESYLKGRYEWNKRNAEGFRKATDYFQAAIAADPRYAQAYAGLADCYNLSLEYYERQAPKEMAAQARSAAEMALRLDPGLSEGHASLAFTLWRYEWDFAKADAEFHKALELNPNNASAHHWYGLFLASRGRFDEARQELHQARILDPMSLIIITNVGWVDYYARDYDGAIASYREALSLDPSFQSAQMKLVWAYERKGMWKEAAEARKVFFTIAGHSEIGERLSGIYATSGYPGVLAAIIAQTGQPDAARYYDDYEIAKLHASAGDDGKALDFLERARAHRCNWLVFLAVEPAFDRLRTHPRFVHLIDEIVSPH